MSLLGYMIIPIIFLVLFVVTAIILIAWQESTPIINAGLASVHAPANYYSTYMGVGNNLYSFDTYLVLIFFFVEIAADLSTIFLNSNPIAWLTGIFLLPFVYYISAIESNVARQFALQPILQAGVERLPLSQLMLANLDSATILFASLYIVLLGIRLFFFNHMGNPNAPSQY